jgi:hypothetical protein
VEVEEELNHLMHPQLLEDQVEVEWHKLLQQELVMQEDIHHQKEILEEQVILELQLDQVEAEQELLVLWHLDLLQEEQVEQEQQVLFQEVQ